MTADSRVRQSPALGTRARALRGRDAPDGARSSRPRGRFVTRAVIGVLAVGAVAVAGTRFLTAHTADRPIASPAPKTLEQQVAALEQRVGADASDEHSWQQLGVAYSQRLVQTNDPSYADLARKALDRALALDPQDAGAIIGKGALSLTLHQFADAHALGARATQLAPESADALAVLVDADVELGRYDDAANDLQKMLDRRPGLAALSRVSYLRELHGDIDGALLALHQAETASGSGSSFDVATVIALRGDVLFNHGRVDDAAQAYDDALRRAPDHLLASLGKARVLVAHGDLDGATRFLSPIADRFPTPAALTLLGDIATVQRRAADAAHDYELVRATYALQQASGAVVDLEQALFEADHGGNAAHVLDLATRAYAARPSVHGADALAWARYRAGDLDGAATAMDEALRLRTREGSFSWHAAAIDAARGNADKARAELEDAFTTNPWFAVANRDEVAALASRLGVAVPTGWPR